MAKCFDDPAAVFEKDYCLSAVSKNLRGEFGAPHPKRHECRKPECKTLRATQVLKVAVSPEQHCDSPLARNLNGTLVVERLASAFDQDGNHRGIHAGEFVWTGVPGVTVKGRISGMTNEGTHRPPAFTECQRCDQRGVMEGLLCGQIDAPAIDDLNGAQITASYRIKFDPTANGPAGGALGTLEGMIITPCRA
jgi:hypothetical protein